MKTLLITLFAILSADAMACRPNTPAIEHRLIMNALTAVNAEKYQNVQDVTEMKVTSLKFDWIHTDSGYQCHDREIAVIALSYQSKTKAASYTVEIQADQGKVTTAKVNEISSTQTE